LSATNQHCKGSFPEKWKRKRIEENQHTPAIIRVKQEQGERKKKRKNEGKKRKNMMKNKGERKEKTTERERGP
jgi:hypothetical protein